MDKERATSLQSEFSRSDVIIACHALDSCPQIPIEPTASYLRFNDQAQFEGRLADSTHFFFSTHFKGQFFFHFLYHQYPRFGGRLHETHDDVDKFYMRFRFSFFSVHNIKNYVLIIFLIQTHSIPNQ